MDMLHKPAAVVVTEYLEELKEYGPTYELWSQSEEELAESLKNVAGSVDRCCKETEEQVKHLNDHLIPVLHEYVLCADTLKVEWPDASALSFLKG